MRRTPKTPGAMGCSIMGLETTPGAWWHAVPILGDPVFGGVQSWGGGPGQAAAMGYGTNVLIFSPPEPPAAAMDEWDLPQWKKEVESLKYQLAYKREMSSKTIPE